MGADDCQRVPGLKCLLLRKVGKANMEHFEDLRRRLFIGLPHDFSAYRGILTFANGSRIIAGHFQSEKDIDAYLGLEYDVIGIEEATTLTYRKYQDISTCCRSSKPLPPPQTLNPPLGNRPTGGPASTPPPTPAASATPGTAQFIIPFRNHLTLPPPFSTPPSTKNPQPRFPLPVQARTAVTRGRAYPRSQPPTKNSSLSPSDWT